MRLKKVVRGLRVTASPVLLQGLEGGPPNIGLKKLRFELREARSVGGPVNEFRKFGRFAAGDEGEPVGVSGEMRLHCLQDSGLWRGKCREGPLRVAVPPLRLMVFPDWAGHDEFGLLGAWLLDADACGLAAEHAEKLRDGPPEFVSVAELVGRSARKRHYRTA